MTTFDDRERAHENKFARDSEMQFKITARRNRLLGLWAAEQMHLKDEDADRYAKDVVVSDLAQPGDDDLVQKLLADLENAGLSITEKEVREQMHTLQSVAREQLHNS